MVDVEKLKSKSPRTQERYLRIIRAIPPGRKMELALELADRIRAKFFKDMQLSNPEMSHEDIRREWIKLRLPEDLRLKVYGW